MMVTDEERREAARRLRLFAESDVPNFVTPPAALMRMAEAVGMEDASDPWLLASRLADLIEPQESTCSMSLERTGTAFEPDCQEKYLMCSHCGFVGYFLQVDEDGNHRCEVPPYCPNCGAKVIG